MDHPVFHLAVYGHGFDARPGYGDTAQTGMFLPFFEQSSRDLPVSMLGEIRCGSLSEREGALMRDILMRQIVAEAVNNRAAGAPLRSSLTRVWRSTLDVWFLVEPQPMADHTVAVGSIEPNGQPVIGTSPAMTAGPRQDGACGAEPPIPAG